jgi:hypothetical protein
MANPFRNNNNFETSPAVSAAFNVPRPITAAAYRIKLEDKSEADQFKLRRNSSTAIWQSAAWEYYDAIGEIKYAFSLVAAVVSRIRLYAAVVENPAETPISIRNSKTMNVDLADAAERGLARLESAYGGQAGLLRDAALNLSVAGECYLVQVPATYDRDESWDIRSVDELQIDQRNNYVITPRRDLMSSANSSGAKLGTIALPKTAFVGRIWRAHPRFSEEPDSSLRGLLDLCDELLLLNRTFRATHRSRLNAGMMYLPDGLTNSAQPDPNLYADDGDPEPTPEEVADDFEDSFMTAMLTPVEDESSPAAVAPLLVRGPTDLGEKIRQFKFERSFDEQMNHRADRVLERILQGLDVPKDIVTGLANVKYSNAIQIDEALYKAHIEPMLLLIADAITVIFLRPYLKSLNNWSEADINRIVVWYDPSAVATRNDRAADAEDGYEKGVISGQTYRRAHGFSEADAPTPNEVIIRLLRDKGALSPEITEALLNVVAPEVMDAVRQSQQATSVAPVPAAAQEILNGAPATDAAAPADGALAAPGEDGPPIPLAEPEQ